MTTMTSPQELNFSPLLRLTNSSTNGDKTCYMCVLHPFPWWPHVCKQQQKFFLIYSQDFYLLVSTHFFTLHTSLWDGGKPHKSIENTRYIHKSCPDSLKLCYRTCQPSWIVPKINDVSQSPGKWILTRPRGEPRLLGREGVAPCASRRSPGP